MAKLLKALAALSAVVAIGAAHAGPVPGQGNWESTLQARDLDRDGVTDAFYDTALNLTWLRNANVNGAMTWSDAVSWVSGYTIGGYGGWRLPTVSPRNGTNFVYGDLPSHPSNSYSGLTDLGFNVSDPHSELGYMFYVTLGNTGYYDTAGNSIPGYDYVNSGLFQNLQNYFYWYGTSYGYAPGNIVDDSGFCAPPAQCAWDFVVGYGDQTIYGKAMPFYAWAVQNGDIGIPIHEPATLALAAAALLGIAGTRRRKPVAPTA